MKARQNPQPKPQNADADTTTTPAATQEVIIISMTIIEPKQNNKLFPIAAIDYQTQLQEIWHKKLAAKISEVLIS